MPSETPIFAPREIAMVASRSIALAFQGEIPPGPASLAIMAAFPTLPHPVLLRLLGRPAPRYIDHLANPNALDLGVYGWSANRIESTALAFQALDRPARERVVAAAHHVTLPAVRGWELLHTIDAYLLMIRTGVEPTDEQLNSWRVRGTTR